MPTLTPRRSLLRPILALCLVASGTLCADEPLHFEDGPQQVFAAKCVRCHGDDQLVRKAELNLQSAAAVLRGGESGAVIVPGKPDESLLWTSINDSVMPPEGEPALTDEERATIKKWIEQGGAARASTAESAIPEAARSFWSFQPLHPTAPPTVFGEYETVNPIDRFLAAELERNQLTFSPPADRRSLIRRLSLDLLGLPPDPADVAAFVADQAPDAYSQLVDRMLASAHYGERWGRHWLDVTGYSDSNGYHRADTLRPLAYRYRDYVVAAINADKPYDRLWTEQLAGDELFRPEERDALRTDVAEALIATHFLRNGPDGTDSTEGNEMVQTIERYAVLEQQLQITITAMFGLTIDCARCHSHKFDPIPQTDYYALQSLLYPAFNVKEWVTPKNRKFQLATPEQLARYEAEMSRISAEIQAQRDGLREWSRAHRPTGNVLFADDFAGEGGLAAHWSNTAPGDDGPAGGIGVRVDSSEAPAARCVDGALHIVDPGGSNGWLTTQQSIDWTPNETGGVIQATFDLIADKLTPEGTAAERIGFYVATRDYNDSTSETGGNILCDGVPDGGANITVDYPGDDGQSLGTLGKTGFKPGRSYGVRITSLGGSKYQWELLVDGLPEDGTLTLEEAQLPDGGFAFEFCCGRSFIVDNVQIESFATSEELAKYREQSQEQSKTVDAAIAQLEAQRPSPPGEIAWVTDLSPAPTEVHLLKRGRYFDPGPAVVPAALSVLSDHENTLRAPAEPTAAGTTGRRRAFAEWATRPDSRAAALLARVQVNRIWMWHFGRGLVDPADNFGAQGTLPSHPELLEWLAAEFVNSGWSTKHIQRLIVMSTAFRQSTEPTPEALTVDPTDRLLWGFPVHRLESEAIRDSMIGVAGVLDDAIGGPPADYQALPNGQVILSEEAADSGAGLSRRTIYYRHRRSEPVTFLQTFDQPAVEPNCLRRGTSAVVSQTLAMLNSEFSLRMARTLAERVRSEAGSERLQQVEQAFERVLSRAPSAEERKQAIAFLDSQSILHSQAGAEPDAASAQAMADFCQVLLASSEFIYVQ